ncbi:MAG: Flp pilus assembly complex ATPase component TadA [Parcubacteria group bacterium]|nr:Flp pilus assembly complex ATPase component TadA [Parcubacteria group bacterium]
MTIDVEKLKKFLIDSNLVTAKNLELAEADSQETGRALDAVLLRRNLVSEEMLAKAKAYVLGIPFVDLTSQNINADILKIIPENIARHNNIVAFRQSGNALEVAMLDPADLQTIDFIKKKSNLEILPRLTSRPSLESAIRQYRRSLEDEFNKIIKTETSEVVKIVGPADKGGGIKTDAQLNQVAQELPVIRVVDALIRHAILENASDIHIEPEDKETVVRYRIDGVLKDVMMLPKEVHQGIVARVKVLSSLKLDEHRLPQDGRFKIESEGAKVSFRVSIFPVYEGEKAVMRLLREDVQGFTLESLGLYGQALESIHRAIKRPTGLVLVTGPTGSGKTTTLYTAMDILNTPEVNIATIEDPIEYRMPRINQTQVRPDIGFTFANGLRNLVRQDPDIVMVGEIRDNETAGLAINASLTGHLVLSTLHTNSAAGAVPRLIDMKVEPFLIASTVNVVAAQRLVRSLCPDSRAKYRLTAPEVAALGREINLEKILKVLKQEKTVGPKETWETIDFYRPQETESCPKGYKGRIGIFEVFEVTDKIQELIVKSATSDEIQKIAEEQGMMTMLEDGFIKAAQGITSIEEVLRASRE